MLGDDHLNNKDTDLPPGAPFQRSALASTHRPSTLPTDISLPSFHLLYLPEGGLDAFLESRATRRTFELLSSLLGGLSQAQWLAPSSPDSGLGPSPTSGSTTQERNAFSGPEEEDEILRSFRKHSRANLPGLDEVNPFAYKLPSTTDPDYEFEDHICAEVKSSALRLVDFFAIRYRERVGDLFREVFESNMILHPETANESGDSFSLEALQLARSHYFIILRELFAKQINWGRIVAMFSFLRDISQTMRNPPPYSLSQSRIGHTPMGASFNQLTETTNQSALAQVSDANGPLNRRAVFYLIWTTEYIHTDERLWHWIEQHGNWEGLVDFETGSRFGSRVFWTFANIAKTVLEFVRRLGAPLFNHPF